MAFTLARYGTRFNDKITSDRLLIDGLEGNDQITGGRYAQEIFGGDGNDTIRGLGGDDLITGGQGRDTFVFEGTRDGNGVDTITDFEAAGGTSRAPTGDVIDLTAIRFVTRYGDVPIDRPVQFSSGNLEDYVWVRDGDLYVDRDGAGRGDEASLAAHLDGVSAGDDVWVKIGKFTGKVEATVSSFDVTLDFEDFSVGVGSYESMGGIAFQGYIITSQHPGADGILFASTAWNSWSGVMAFGAAGGGDVIALNNYFADTQTTIVREDGGDFIFVGGDFADLNLNPVSLTFSGYNNGNLVGTATASVGMGAVATVPVDLGGAIDTLLIGHTGIGSHTLLMDNLGLLSA